MWDVIIIKPILSGFFTGDIIVSIITILTKILTLFQTKYY